MRLPNGYGSVYKLSGNRRRPWIARKTIGWDENDKQLYETIGYYEKRQDALDALADYNRNPFDIEQSKITFKEVFDLWSEKKYKEVSRSSINGYNASMAICDPLHDMRFVDIRTKHMQDIIDKCDKGNSTIRRVKVLYNQLFAYAMANDIVSKDYSDYVEIPKKENSTKRKPFTEKEIKRLFGLLSNDEFPIIDTILIMIYTGLRVGELIIIKNTDIDIDNRVIVGGIKTEAGKDRVIPINKKILPLVKARMEQGHEYFISRPNGKPYLYDNYYRENWIPTMTVLNMDHTPHDCRHTFASRMDKAGANKKALQNIIGHANYSTTADIYTHQDIEELLNAIDLLE